jgi:hypothetical protein
MSGIARQGNYIELNDKRRERPEGTATEFLTQPGSRKKMACSVKSRPEEKREECSC